MNKSKNWVDCQERFRRVIAYIQDHMYDELDMNRLAEVACLFHPVIGTGFTMPFAVARISPKTVRIGLTGWGASY